MQFSNSFYRYEGDNYILHQQVCRAAVKAYAQYSKDPSKFAQSASPSTRYLQHLNKTNSITLDTQNISTSTLAELLGLRGAKLVQQISLKARATKIWTDLSWDCVKISGAITEAYIADRLTALLAEKESTMLAGLGNREQDVIERLVRLVRLDILVDACKSAEHNFLSESFCSIS
jgi:acyl-CoA oxidase